jgi:hypothetical protein
VSTDRTGAVGVAVGAGWARGDVRAVYTSPSIEVDLVSTIVGYDNTVDKHFC